MENNKTCTCLSSALITTCKFQPSLTEWERFQRYEVPVGFTVQAAGLRMKMHLRAPPNSSVYETQENPPQPSLWSTSTGPSCCLLSARHPHLRSRCFIGNICSCLGESSWSSASASAASAWAVPKSLPALFCPFTGSQQGWWQVTGKAEGHFLRAPHAPTQCWGFIFNPKLKKYALVLARSMSETIRVLNDWTQSTYPNYLVNLATNIVAVRGASKSLQRSEVTSGLSLTTLNVTKAPKILFLISALPQNATNTHSS